MTAAALGLKGIGKRFGPVGANEEVDLAVAAALVSALAERPVPADAVAFGEVALSGELRPVAHAAIRLKESAKLGFERALVPSAGGIEAGSITPSRFPTLGRLVDHLLGRG